MANADKDYYLGYQLAAAFDDVVWIGDWPWTPGMADRAGRRLVDLSSVHPTGKAALYWVEDLPVGGRAGTYQAAPIDYSDRPVPDLNDPATLGAAVAMGELS